MTDIPDDAVDAIVDAIAGGTISMPGGYCNLSTDDAENIAQAALTAAAPIIRADERRRVAEEIRAAAWPTDKADTEGLDFGYALGRNAGLDIAAQIAGRSGE